MKATIENISHLTRDEQSIVNIVAKTITMHSEAIKTLQEAIILQAKGRSVNAKTLYLSLFQFTEHLGIESPETFEMPTNFLKIFSDLVESGKISEIK